VPDGKDYLHEIQAAILAMESFGHKFEDHEVLGPADVATGHDLQHCIWAAKMFLMMTVDLISTDISVVEH
jgi:hypothetical protein